MNGVRYVLLDPSGNLTCLVLDPVEERKRGTVTAALMDRCEQVGYLTPPEDPRARARLQMMGGEFCGNASMAAAAWLAGEDGLTEGEETTVPLEVSGAEGVIPCRVRRERDGWTGTVEMPLIREVKEITLNGETLTGVAFPGMLHLIARGKAPGKEEAETALLNAAAVLPFPALGRLQWEERTGRMTPLVYVRESGTLVWETACGSGSAAIAAWKALETGRDARVEVIQPGGVLTAEARLKQGTVYRILLTGSVRIGGTGVTEG